MGLGDFASKAVLGERDAVHVPVICVESEDDIFAGDYEQQVEAWERGWEFGFILE